MPSLPSLIATPTAIVPTHAIAIVIADDHQLFRAGLRRLLEAESDLRVIGEAADGDAAIDAVGLLNPDVLLLDLCMRRRSGFDVLRALAHTRPSPPHTIVLTATIDDDQVIEALQLGAQGIVMKDCPTPHLFKSIRAVVSGEYWVGRERVTNLVRHLQAMKAASADDPRRTCFGLTPRERQIVSAIAAGETNRDIAQRLSLSADTVKHHLTNVFDKCGVSNRLELALFAVTHRLVDTP